MKYGTLTMVKLKVNVFSDDNMIWVCGHILFSSGFLSVKWLFDELERQFAIRISLSWPNIMKN